MNIEANLEEILSSYDWEEVFGEGSGGNCTQDVESLDGTHCAPVLRADIAEVLASVNGENDGPDWVCIVRMEDGRFVCAQGGCDYTGWDCRAGNTITVASTLEALLASGVTQEWAERLGVV